jgi:tubulin polyglutamylase TTLL11
MLRKLITRNGWKEVNNQGDVCWLGLPFKYDNLDEYFT